MQTTYNLFIRNKREKFMITSREFTKDNFLTHSQLLDSYYLSQAGAKLEIFGTGVDV